MVDSETAIYWIKRDFRLADNPALTAALAAYPQVIPLFILEPSFLRAPETSVFHVHAVTDALTDLRQRLQEHGKDVAVIKGEVVPILEQLRESYRFQHIFAHEEIGTERTFARDRAVRAWCAKKGVELTECRQTGVFRALEDRNKRHQLWRKFNTSDLLPIPSDWQRCYLPEAWRSLALKKEEPLTVESLGYSWDAVQADAVQPVSETAAQQTLHDFLHNRGIAYRGGISSPLTAFTAGSRLSVHLAWGTITGRAVYQATQARMDELKQLRADGDPTAGKFSSSLRSFSSRLHWRDHFIQRLESEPNMEFEALNPAYRELEYDDRPDFLEAWKTGYTGYPMVDACVRCLRATGFVNFRMRAMLVSFACHTLRLHWKWLDHPMARWYTDYEPGIHLSQLQMQAGVVGINTLRIYSPTKQIIDQDPDAIFIKEWVPELRDFSPEAIQAHRDEALGDYPAQLVDWKEASSEMRRRVYAVRRQAGYRETAQQVYEKHGSRRASPKRKKKKTAKTASK